MTGSTSALVVIDIQNDFLPGGSLAVADGHSIVPRINELARKFRNVVITQDWHPQRHISFASSHPGKVPFDRIELSYGPQVLWPEHCVQGTFGAALADGLDIPHAQLILRKGYHDPVDSYSAFFEADRKTPTGLAGYLRERGIEQVHLAGVATDFCVNWSAQDARASGFETVLVEDACRAIDMQNSLAEAIVAMEAAGVRRIHAGAL